MSPLFYDLSYPHPIDMIYLPFLGFCSPMQILSSFLLVNESYINNILKLRLNHIQCMRFENRLPFLHNFFFIIKGCNFWSGLSCSLTLSVYSSMSGWVTFQSWMSSCLCSLLLYEYLGHEEWEWMNFFF